MSRAHHDETVFQQNAAQAPTPVGDWAARQREDIARRTLQRRAAVQRDYETARRLMRRTMIEGTPQRPPSFFRLVASWLGLQR